MLTYRAITNEIKSTNVAYWNAPQFAIYIVRVRFIQTKMEDKIKNLENYLNDLDNLIDTGWFPKDSVKECTFYHKDLTLRDFVSKGREYIRQYLMAEKGVS